MLGDWRHRHQSDFEVLLLPIGVLVVLLVVALIAAPQFPA